MEVSYKLIGKNRYSFVVAKADPSLPIVIDPILQSTYLGGSGSDTVYALAIHPTTGEVYVAGDTNSNDFPGISGGAQTTCNGCVSGSSPIYDAFVARLTADLTADSGSGGGSGGSDSGSGSGGSGTGGSGTGGSGGSGAVGGTGGGGGGGCSMTGSASSMAGLWNILVWLSVPAFALARRIRKK